MGISATATGTATNFLRSAIVQKHRSAVADFPRLPNLQVKGMAESSARACRRKIIATATGTAAILLRSAIVQKHRSAVVSRLFPPVPRTSNLQVVGWRSRLPGHEG